MSAAMTMPRQRDSRLAIARVCLAAREHFAEDLKKIDVPTLVLHGDDA
jgi:hypothetical protein